MSRLRGSLLLLLMLAAVAVAIDQALEDEEIRAVEHMTALDAQINHQRNAYANVAWAYGSNVTEYNARLKNEASAENAIFYKVSVPDHPLRRFHIG